MKLEKYILAIYDDDSYSTTLTAFHAKADAYKAMIKHAQENYKDDHKELFDEHFYDEGGYISFDDSVTGKKFEYSIHVLEFEVNLEVK